jgi:hypothetical protein
VFRRHATPLHSVWGRVPLNGMAAAVVVVEQGSYWGIELPLSSVLQLDPNGA